MSAPTYGTAGTKSQVAAATDPTPGYPVNIVAGSLLLLHVYIHDAAGSVVTPTGWTLITGPISHAAGRAWLFAKRADGTESGTLTVDTTATAGNQCAAQMLRIDSWNDTGNVADAFEGTNNNGATSTTDTAATVTTLDQDRLLVAFRAFSGSIASSVDNYSGGATWGNHTEAGSTNGNNGTIAAETATIAAAATISGATDAITSSAWGNIVTAIKPYRSRTPAINFQNPAVF